jgi:hypothetical protein
VLRLCAFDSACSNGADVSALPGGFGFMCSGWVLAAASAPDAGGSGGAVGVPSLSCLEDAKTCADWWACSAPTPAEEALCGGKTGDRCVNGVALEGCPKPTSATDCGASGLACTTDTEPPWATCTSVTCDGGNPLHCEGNTLIGCDPSAGTIDHRDCTRADGFQYVSGGYSPQPLVGVCENAQCVGAGAPCTASPPNDMSCQGSAVVGCAGGRMGTFDCATLGLGLTCAQAPASIAYCTSTDADCDGSATESCSNGVITSCLFGKTTSIDCKSYGFSGCAFTAGGEGGVSPAPYCTSASAEMNCNECACVKLMSEGGCADICQSYNLPYPNFCDGVPALVQCAACLMVNCPGMVDTMNPSACM